MQALLPPVGSLWVSNSDAVEIRAHPVLSPGVADVDSLRRGDLATVVEVQPPWVRLLYRGKSGWVFHARMTRWCTRAA